MILEPTAKQREYLAQLSGRMAILSFLSFTDPARLPSYLQTSQQAVEKEGGHREIDVQIDLVLAGEPTHFSHITLDEFPNSATAAKAHDATTAVRTEHIAETHALIVRLDKQLPRITKVLQWFRPIFRAITPIDPQKTINSAKILSGPPVHMWPEAYEQFLTRERETPFYNLNLSKCYDRQRDASAITKEIYNPSGKKVLALGVYLAAMGDVLGTWIGNESQPLYDQWDEFSLPHWPSRQIFLTYLANVAPEVVDARSSYFSRALQIPCTDRLTPRQNSQI